MIARLSLTHTRYVSTMIDSRVAEEEASGVDEEVEAVMGVATAVGITMVADAEVSCCSHFV